VLVWRRWWLKLAPVFDLGVDPSYRYRPPSQACINFEDQCNSTIRVKPAWLAFTLPLECSVSIKSIRKMVVLVWRWWWSKLAPVLILKTNGTVRSG